MDFFHADSTTWGNRLQTLARLVRRCHHWPAFHRLAEPLRSMAARRFRGHTLEAPFDNDLRILCRLDEHMSSQIFWYGAYARHLLPILDEVLDADSLFIDIGANQGEFSLYAAKRCRQVFAFEPSAEPRRRLEANIRLNGLGNVAVEPLALGDKPGRMALYEADELFVDGTHNSGLASLFQAADRPRCGELVQVETLDDYLERRDVSRVDCIKLDIEGGELAALAGAKRTITRDKPCLIVELNEATCQAAGVTAQATLDCILGFGYTVYRIGHKGGRQLVQGRLAGGFQDVLCLHRDKR